MTQRRTEPPPAPQPSAYPKQQQINIHPHALETEPQISQQYLGRDPNQQKVRNAENTNCWLPSALPRQHGQHRLPVPVWWLAGEFPPPCPHPMLVSKKETKSLGRGFGESRLGLSGKSVITDCLKWGLEPRRQSAPRGCSTG